MLVSGSGDRQVRICEHPNSIRCWPLVRLRRMSREIHSAMIDPYLQLDDTLDYSLHYIMNFIVCDHGSRPHHR